MQILFILVFLCFQVPKDIEGYATFFDFAFKEVITLEEGTLDVSSLRGKES